MAPMRRRARLGNLDIRTTADDMRWLPSWTNLIRGYMVGAEQMPKIRVVALLCQLIAIVWLTRLLGELPSMFTQAQMVGPSLGSWGTHLYAAVCLGGVCLLFLSSTAVARALLPKISDADSLSSENWPNLAEPLWLICVICAVTSAALDFLFAYVSLAGSVGTSGVGPRGIGGRAALLSAPLAKIAVGFGLLWARSMLVGRPGPVE